MILITHIPISFRVIATTQLHKRKAKEQAPDSANDPEDAAIKVMEVDQPTPPSFKDAKKSRKRYRE